MISIKIKCLHTKNELFSGSILFYKLAHSVSVIASQILIVFIYNILLTVAFLATF